MLGVVRLETSFHLLSSRPTILPSSRTDSAVQGLAPRPLAYSSPKWRTATETRSPTFSRVDLSRAGGMRHAPGRREVRQKLRGRKLRRTFPRRKRPAPSQLRAAVNVVVGVPQAVVCGSPSPAPPSP
eukprot:6618521-Prymnesium_polylepis.1